ncbi:enterotoxin A family protein [Klebsiella sp. BIGb0407]|uniref:enterotoxin A family protein n=1 Tax=Klebsiella sp. BIGb0407 TaxID=2940603 RepID=UPI0021688EB2|nr:enterotoxin A family protein [Klebsiella sp. BIGb0407]MCS3431397.1 pertussis toxin subunit 1 [Klebsiella sp. BIGb0407]
MRLRIFSLTICMLCMVTTSYAIESVKVVYRVDDRPIDAIAATGGMHPWAGERDTDLMHHFEGESIEHRVSSFVSTSASLRQVIEHAASLARSNSEEPFNNEYITYIYAIRPNEQFYDVRHSLLEARETSQDDIQRNRLTRLIHDYADMDEIVAVNGFRADRLIRYAELTGNMLNTFYDTGQLFSEVFWSGRWTDNTAYNHAYDTGASNTESYRNIGSATGSITLVSNSNASSSLLGITCLGAPASSSGSRAERSIVSVSNSCISYKLANTRRVIYDRKILAMVFFLI